MKPWSITQQPPEEAPEPPDDTTESIEAQVHEQGGAAPGTAAALAPDETYRILSQVTVRVELDDGLTVPVELDDHNAALIVEATQRLREYREREKASVPPVQDFGEPAWSASEW